MLSASRALQQMPPPSGRTYVIPGDEPIHIPSTDLPDATELAEVLITSNSAMKVWVDFICEYAHQGKFDACEVLTKAIPQRVNAEAQAKTTIPPRPEKLMVDKTSLMKLNATYMSIILRHGTSKLNELGKSKTSAEKVSARFLESKNWLDILTRLAKTPGVNEDANPLESASAALLSFFEFTNEEALRKDISLAPGASSHSISGDSAQNNFEAAFANFNSHVKKLKDSISTDRERNKVFGSLLVKFAEALQAWQKNDFVAARACYVDIIERNHAFCGALPRIGLGFCLSRMGHIEAAKLAFKRALQLDPSNATALGALSYLEANGQSYLASLGLVDEADISADANAQSKAVKRSFELAKRSIAVEPETPLALLELSHHYFSNWSEVISESSGEGLRVFATRGSRRLVLNETDVSLLSNFKAGSTIKVIGKALDGKTVSVPMRLVSHEAAVAVSRNRVEESNVNKALSEFQPQQGASGAARKLLVLNCRQPWALPSTGGLILLTVNISMSERQARQALQASISIELKCEAAFALGRALHAQFMYNEAASNYSYCLKRMPKHVAARTALAQCKVAISPTQNVIVDAITDLKKVLELRPTDRSATKLLAVMHVMLQRPDEALDFARKATELAPWDVTAVALFASVSVRSETTKPATETAIRATEAAIEKLSERATAVPISLYGNVGVLRCRLASFANSTLDRHAEYKRADEAFQKALIQLVAEELPGCADDLLLNAEAQEAALFNKKGSGATLAFNISILRELQGRTAESEAQLEKLLKHHPAYLDCHLRLALSALHRGDVKRSDHHATEALNKGRAILSSPPHSKGAAKDSALYAVVTALILLGQLAERQLEKSQARELYEKAVAEAGASSDPYALLSIANLDFQDLYLIPSVTPAPAGDPLAIAKESREKEAYRAQRDEVLRKAFDSYKAVLKRWPSNAYAAVGLGNVEAEQGKLEHARDVFLLIREAAPLCAPALVSLGHTYVALGQHEAAAQTYAQLLRRFHGHSAGPSSTPEEQAKVLLYVSRAYADGQRWGEACRVLLRAVALTPWDLRLQFNLAYAQCEEGIRIGNVFVQEQQVAAAAAAEKIAAAEAAASGNTETTTSSSSSLHKSAPVSTITADDLARAVEGMQSSLATFQWLLRLQDDRRGALRAAEIESATAPGVTTTSLTVKSALAAFEASTANGEIKRENLVRFIGMIEGHGYVSALKEYLGRARLSGVEARRKMQERSREFAERERVKLEEEREKQAIEEEKRLAQLQAAELLKAKLEERRLAWAQADAARSSTGKKGKKGGATVEGVDGEAGEDGEEEAAAPQPKRGKKGKKVRRGFDESDDDKADEGKRGKEGRGNSSDDSPEEEEEGRSSGKARGKGERQEELNDLFGPDFGSGGGEGGGGKRDANDDLDDLFGASPVVSSRKATTAQVPAESQLDDLFGATTALPSSTSGSGKAVSGGNTASARKRLRKADGEEEEEDNDEVRPGVGDAATAPPVVVAPPAQKKRMVIADDDE